MVGTEAKVYWVYITASGPRGVLYVGMTGDYPVAARSIARA